jgi:hypothetical protein
MDFSVGLLLLFPKNLKNISFFETTIPFSSSLHLVVIIVGTTVKFMFKFVLVCGNVIKNIL